MDSAAVTEIPPGSARVSRLFAKLQSDGVIWSGYAASAALAAAAVGLGSSPSLSGPLGPASPMVLALIAANLVLIAALWLLIGRRLLRLAGDQTGDAGARLHLRFVALFATAAVLPALVVALFFGVLVTRGIDAWFNARVQSVFENSARVAASYVEEQSINIRDHATLMARDLNSAGPSELAASPVAFSQFLMQQAQDNGFTAAYVLNGAGRVIAAAPVSGAPRFLAPPAEAFQVADQGEVPEQTFKRADLFRALYRLRSFPDAYLYVAWPVESGVFAHLSETEASLAAYRTAKASRAAIRDAFYLVYAEVVVIVLLGAVSFGMSAASSIAAPVARLVKAAGQVASGDLSIRVDASEGPEEIVGLTRAFNSMTRDLETQQSALVNAHAEVESRRQFVETMLEGVSAGVIGLDRQGRISVVNSRAAQLLGPTGAGLGSQLRELAPEFDDASRRAVRTGAEVEADLDVVRAGEPRRLRLRIGHSPDGLVLTFDDITRLVAAQRNAAWKDVARRIAHEIKNPLTPIQLSAERLRRKYRKELSSDLETFDRCTDTIIRQVGDIGRMVDEFSAFARMPAPKFAEADAAELLRQAVFAQRVADPDTVIEIEAPDEARIVCDARMIGQALANLLKNAGEAIAARRAGSAAAPGLIRARLARERGLAVFEVEDNGVGLPAKDRDRLTEPYVTTREKGTGLGLAIVERIMEEHGGQLSLADARRLPGARATLRLSLAAAATSPRRQPKKTAPELKDA